MYMYDRPIPKGKLAELSFDTYGVKYDHFSGGDYRRETGGDFGFGLREGLQLNGNVDFSQFEGSDDHTYTIGLLHPRSDPYKNVGVNYTWGRIEGAQYRNISFNTAQRFFNKLQLGLTAQFVHLTTDQKQIIMSGTYDLGHDRALSGRLVQADHDFNAYVAIQKSGNAGMEYFLILGDPNSTKFKRSLILKITYPLQMFLSKRSH